MKQRTTEKSNKDFMRVISIFILIFAFLVFIAVFLTEGIAARMTNLICSLLLAGVAGIFYYGFRKEIK